MTVFHPSNARGGSFSFAFNFFLNLALAGLGSGGDAWRVIVRSSSMATQHLLLMD